MSEEFFLSTPIKTYNAPLSARTDVAALQPVNHLPITCKSPISQGLIDPNGRLIGIFFSSLTKFFCLKYIFLCNNIYIEL